jgi:DNA-directed RNA polymerase subunit RPC12/RpoP
MPDSEKCEICGDPMGLPCWNCGKIVCYDHAKNDPTATIEEPEWVCPECQPKLASEK